MKVVVVANPKGGVVKSTTAIHMTNILRQKGLKALLIDFDSQGNASSYYDVKPGGLWAVLNGAMIVEDAAQNDILSASGEIGELWMKVIKRPSLMSSLKRILADCKSYDFTIIDTPGYIGVELGMALQCADSVIMPVTPSEWAIETFQGLAQEMRNYCKDGVELTILPAAFGKAQDDQAILSGLENLGLSMLNPVPFDKNVKIRTEAKKPLDPRSLAHKAYEEVVSFLVGAA